MKSEQHSFKRHSQIISGASPSYTEKKGMEKLEALIERSYPYAWGLLAAVFAFMYAQSLIGWGLSEKVDILQLFTAVFNIALVLTGFLFTFFGLAIAPGGGFIEKLLGTRTFRIFKGYIAEALALGSILAICCIPFMVIKLKEIGPSPELKVFITIWVFLCVSTIFPSIEWPGYF